MFTKEGKFQTSFDVNIVKLFNTVSADKTLQYIKEEHVITEVITQGRQAEKKIRWHHLWSSPRAKGRESAGPSVQQNDYRLWEDEAH